MLKALLRTAFHSLGYSVTRLTRPPAPPSAAVSVPPLCPLRVELFPGFPVELDLSDHVQRLACIDSQTYEYPAPALLRSFCIDEDAIFFDIGANFGYYSYYILAHCPAATVHSFEPNPAHLARQQSVAARLPRYHPHQLGLSDSAGQLDLTVSSLDSGWSTFGVNPHFQGLEPTLITHHVPVTTFDEWCAANQLSLPAKPAWIVKMDVEGYEPRVLRGMARALAAKAFKVLLIEILDHTLNFCGTSAAEVFRLLDEAGYEAFDDRLRPTSRQSSEARNVLFLPRVRGS